MEIPRHMKAAHRTTINHSLNGDDVVNFVPVRTVAVDGLQSIFVNPRRGTKSYVLAAKIKSRWVRGVVRPSFAPLLVNGLPASIVSGLFLHGDAFAVVGVSPVAIEPPCVLARHVSADVFSGTFPVVGIGADFAPVADAGKFRVILGAGLTDPATWTDFEREWHRKIGRAHV